MAGTDDHSYLFGPFRLDAAERRLTRGGRPVRVTSKVLDILLALVRSPGQLIEKDELMNQVWPDSFVEENNLTVGISSLRKALSEGRSGRRTYIETVPGRGYRFVADVTTLPRGAAHDAPPSREGGREDCPVGVDEGAIDSLAVLPLANVSGDPRLEYLSDGITECIINSLSRLPGLRVIARSTVFRYKGREDDPLSVGRKLGVRAVLVGRLLRCEGVLAFGFELVDVKDGSQLWGEHYERPPKEVLALQDEISTEIAGKLRLRLAGSDVRRLAMRYTENTQAYHLYLKGRYFWNRCDLEGLKKALEYFRRAVDLDPCYALAYAGIADSYFRLSSSYLPPREALPKARAAAMRALEIDESLAEARASSGVVKARYDWDWSGAESEFLRAIELRPGYATAHHWYAMCLNSVGRFEEALKESELAAELDPLSLQIQVSMGAVFWLMRRYDLAVGKLREVLEMEPNFLPARMALGLVYDAMGNYPQSVVELRKAVRLGQTAITAGFLARAYAVAGRKEKALAASKDLRKWSNGNYVSAYCVALIHEALGETDESFNWLERAYEERDEWLGWLKLDPRLDRLRPDPRYADLLKRVGLR
jgi:TolB-like protein/DNA-binding winged helix-turn-helix (wHTH) protein/Flp pilus assembly protein TadD